MTVKGLWHIYRLAKWPVINDIKKSFLKVKINSLNSYANIKSRLGETWIFAPGNPKDACPQPSNADLALKDPARSSHQNACDDLKTVF